MTKDIKLKDVPKSKNILEHIDFANELTNSSGKEYGFNFCKLNNKITVDRMCKGSECAISISPTVCIKDDNFFHIHPNRKVYNLSINDIYASSIRSHRSKKPHIVCVKGEFDDNILCKKINAKKFSITDVSQLRKEFRAESTTKKYKETHKKLEETIKPETIIFSKAGKLLYHHDKSEV